MHPFIIPITSALIGYFMKDYYGLEFSFNINVIDGKSNNKNIMYQLSSANQQKILDYIAALTDQTEMMANQKIIKDKMPSGESIL
ncbi:uncharacterized protein KGF55_001628 [Candida pseudojiufengensis]|uniref:uncharacterized protein n=1 Tax=Candida pseudojiufengensis TaxID=497109 RepID=UPI0022252463|nr:uncharacterized protein KGF55_001628 [Candida pseudojiufengensis]KAI5965407.1 hypothetical protein KGF55_001628 [Candida pseudojiufengensis]